MATKRPQGQYRKVPVGEQLPMAYVIDRGTASYVNEATYRAKCYEPDFDKLPTEDEFDA